MAVHENADAGSGRRSGSFLFVLSVGIFASYVTAQKAFRTIHNNKRIFMLKSKGLEIFVFQSGTMGY